MNPNTSNEAEWFCVRTQTKREHIAASHLADLDGIEVFCPRLRYRKATRRGKIWWIEALFPGYLLAKFNLLESERAVTFCHGVRGLVRFGSEIPPVPEPFIQRLRSQLAEQAGYEDSTLTLSPSIENGDEIEVATGPLRGLKGTVVAVSSAQDRVKILLEFLGRPQTIDLDLFSILLPRRPLPPQPL
jgi:transcriptional antiterminator RfaH